MLVLQSAVCTLLPCVHSCPVGSAKPPRDQLSAEAHGARQLVRRRFEKAAEERQAGRMLSSRRLLLDACSLDPAEPAAQPANLLL